MRDGLELPAEAYALRPVRTDVKNDGFVFYEAVTFPEGDPRGICEMYLRRARICGLITADLAAAPDGALYQIEVLDRNNDPIMELYAARKAFRYIIEKLKLKVDRS